MAAMDCFIKSASDGPPRRELRASALIGWPEGRSALGSVVEVGSAEGCSEFSIPHLSSWFMPGSMTMCGSQDEGRYRGLVLQENVKMYNTSLGLRYALVGRRESQYEYREQKEAHEIVSLELLSPCYQSLSSLLCSL